MIVKLSILALFPIFAAVAFLIAFFTFYRGGYEAPAPVDAQLAQITTSSAPSRVVTGLPPGELRQGLLVVDAQHVNAFPENELVSFTSQVADRGFEVEVLGDFLPIADPSLAQSRLVQLAGKLRQADAFAVIQPRAAFTESEAALVEQFVRKGGKLLLVSDPGRPQQTNSLAKKFGVDFQADYLYNTVDNDANFRRIFVRDFQPDRLTSGLEEITLEYAGSVQSSGGGLAFTGPGTKSSLLDTSETFSIVAWGDSRNVLAISDFTFMVPSHDSLLDNGKLVANIADYVTDSDREFLLTDFPHFYGSGSNTGVDILIGQPALLGNGQTMKNGLAPHSLSSRISPVEDVSRDTVFLGLFEDAPQVSQYLESAGVRVDDTLGTPFVNDLPLEGTAIVVLDQSQGRDMLVVLADTSVTLSGAIARLFSGEYRSDLLNDFVGVHKFQAASQ